MESAIYQRWLDAGYFTADPGGAKPGYSIVLPPPNVTGSLHMGHALEHTMMDALTRRKRMQGYAVLWQPGMDHAGIATQSVVEKQLAVDGKTKEDFGRELFIDKVWDWKHDSGGTIAAQMRRLGDGVDWSRDRFTMDDGLSRAVRTIFKRLFDTGLIYRAERLVNWAPVLETAVDGLDRFEARIKVREALAEQGRIVEEKRPYLHSVGHSERSGEVIEPRLSMQWWVKVESLAKAAGDAVRNGDTVIHPPSLEPRWFAWVDNMHDWCISRQLWWGHRIPIWHGPKGQMVCVGPDETPPEGWEQDPDVLDTWFSSALWPFSTMGWPDHTPELRRFYPTDRLVTGYDILFFWVARMMMFGTYVGDDPAITIDGKRGPQVPFENVFLHALIRDEFGRKLI